MAKDTTTDAGATEAEVLTPEQIEAAALAAREADKAARAKTKAKYYKTVHGGVMIDPETKKEFSGEKPTKSELTSWLQFQIDNLKITEDE